ncbi:NAD(P)-dependent oxidoreductase [Chromobacterium vaccinii]|uniref:NAD(P)-dependent oxidoreductase n=1 Tax=Chromobacterium vaccinii TaxID=1108595 RepID=UPI000E1FC920|nr:NAD(P)-dependent oxidoreductase [Chromobacterium vaccinii]
MAKVYITDRIVNPDIEREILGDDVSLDFDQDAEVLMVWRQLVDQEFIDKFPKLKAIQRYGVGYDRLDLAYAKSKGIYVSNNPAYCTEEVAQTAMAFILNCSRKIGYLDHFAKNNLEKWQQAVTPPTKRISCSTVAIIGAGRIGSRVCAYARALGYRVEYYDPFLNAEQVEKLDQIGAVKQNNLEDLIGGADIVSLHVPATEYTVGMVDADFLRGMKSGASLVNTSRGSTMVHPDIFLDFLQNNHLNQLMLDVLPEEPPRPCAFIEAWRTPPDWLKGRILVNPHKSYFSSESSVEMRVAAARNVKRLLDGLVPDFIVNN